MTRDKSSLLSVGNDAHKAIFGLVGGVLGFELELMCLFAHVAKLGGAGFDENFVESSQANISRG